MEMRYGLKNGGIMIIDTMRPISKVSRVIRGMLYTITVYFSSLVVF